MKSYLSLIPISAKVRKMAFSSIERKSRCWTEPSLSRMVSQTSLVSFPFSAKRARRLGFLMVTFILARKSSRSVAASLSNLSAYRRVAISRSIP